MLDNLGLPTDILRIQKDAKASQQLVQEVTVMLAILLSRYELVPLLDSKGCKSHTSLDHRNMHGLPMDNLG